MGDVTPLKKPDEYPYCDKQHLWSRCPRISAIEYDEDANVARVELDGDIYEEVENE